jgi:hypothetical protein
LKHTRKHKRRRNESNQRTKLSSSGGLSGQAGRTVRKGRADSPARCHGQSTRDTRTVRQGATDYPLKTTEPPEPTREKTGRPRRLGGPSAWVPDRPLLKLEPSTNRLQRKPKTKSDRKQRHARTRRTHSPRTVRHRLADRPHRTDRAENCSIPRVNSPNPSQDLPNGRSC